MRARLTLTSMAVTALVVIAFLIPLGLLVRDLARDRALSSAEREAEAIARFITVVGPNGVDQAVAVFGDRNEDDLETSVILASGEVVGAPLRPGEDGGVAGGGSAVRVAVPGGEAVYVPILQSDGSLLTVRVLAPEALLTRGVLASWMTLAVLGLALVAIAAFVFDRLARSIVGPVVALSETASALGEGKLDVRVEPAGPPEVEAVGIQFNLLAERVRSLLQQERETAADLSHQLRTPLTALRLDVEALPEGQDKTRLLDDVDELTRYVDFVISEARREVRRSPGITIDLVAAVSARLDFWRALAEEQGRRVTTRLPEEPIEVDVPRADLDAMLDALVGNVFAHTPESAPIELILRVSSNDAVLTVSDGGPGFADPTVLERGTGSGTGLGLDIAKRTAESAGGSLSIDVSATLGGAEVTVTIPT